MKKVRKKNKHKLRSDEREAWSVVSTASSSYKKT